eukprot:9502970-Pyramimonas_sp.AAC.1
MIQEGFRNEARQNHARSLGHASVGWFFGCHPGPSWSPSELSEAGLVGLPRAPRGLQNGPKGLPKRTPNIITPEASGMIQLGGVS